MVSEGAFKLNPEEFGPEVPKQKEASIEEKRKLLKSILEATEAVKSKSRSRSTRNQAERLVGYINEYFDEIQDSKLLKEDAGGIYVDGHFQQAKRDAEEVLPRETFRQIFGEN